MELDLSGKRLRSMTEIAKLVSPHDLKSELKSLNLQNNFIEPATIISLCDFLNPNTQLTSLNIGTNMIGSSMVYVSKFVKNSTSLESLSVFEGRIGDHGARALAENVENHPSLEYLNVNANGIRLPALVDLMLTLTTCPKLKDFHVWGNDVDGEQLIAIHKTMNTHYALHTGS
jgi:Ran GTPase-activating protein (RanGAP) involved in mRNA processing and transport